MWIPIVYRFELFPTFRRKFLMLQHIMQVLSLFCLINVHPTLLQQLGESPFLFQLDIKKGFPSVAWKNLSGLHRALTLAPSNTSGTNWNANHERGLVNKHQLPTQLTLLWLCWCKHLQPGPKILWRAFARGVEAVNAAYNGHGFEIKCPTITYGHNVHMSHAFAHVLYFKC